MNVIRKFYGTGFGNLHTQGRTIPAPAPGPPGPPFLLTSANSGLWVDPVTGVIQLDGSGGLNPLLQNTLIQTGVFLYEIGDVLGLLDGSLIAVNNVTGQTFLGDLNNVTNGNLLTVDNINNSLDYVFSGNSYFRSSPGVDVYALGDIGAHLSGHTLIINGAGQRIDLGQRAGLNTDGLLTINQTELIYGNINVAAMSLDINTSLYRVGDYGNNANGNFLQIDDANQVSALGDVNTKSSGSQILIDNAIPLFQYFTSTGTFLNANPGVGRYQFGDIGSSANGHLLDINDATQIIDLGDNVGILLRLDNSSTPGTMTYFGGVGQRFLELDGTNQVYSMGDIDAVGSSSVLIINDPNKLVFVQAGPTIALKLDGAGQRYQIGDTNNSVNGSTFTVEDSSKRFIMRSDPVSAFQYFFADVPNQLYQFGDISAASPGNNTFININDSTQRVTVNGSPQLIGTTTSYTNGAGANIGTLLNAPAAGNPTKWIPINDNGTTRFIPAW